MAQDDGLPDKCPQKAPLQILELQQLNHQSLNRHRALIQHKVQDQHLDSGALNTTGRAPIARMAISPTASPPRPVANFGSAQTPVRPQPSQHTTHLQQTPAQRAARRLESQIIDYGPMASPGSRRRDWNDNTSDEDENDIRLEQSVEENDSEPEEASRPPAANVVVLNSDDSDDESQKPSGSGRQQPRGRRAGRQDDTVIARERAPDSKYFWGRHVQSGSWKCCLCGVIYASGNSGTTLRGHVKREHAPEFLAEIRA
ncbi:hypothetical protein B0H14DRAFT_2612873 [Mycena olivaceomarginata]|nr:hypothetical protein B0H14DRAFT_2612873 [Mycena olivaceomarginata]